MKIYITWFFISNEHFLIISSLSWSLLSPAFFSTVFSPLYDTFIQFSVVGVLMCSWCVSVSTFHVPVRSRSSWCPSMRDVIVYYDVSTVFDWIVSTFLIFHMMQLCRCYGNPIDVSVCSSGDTHLSTLFFAISDHISVWWCIKYNFPSFDVSLPVMQAEGAAVLLMVAVHSNGNVCPCNTHSDWR